MGESTQGRQKPQPKAKETPGKAVENDGAVTDAPEPAPETETPAETTAGAPTDIEAALKAFEERISTAEANAAAQIAAAEERAAAAEAALEAVEVGEPREIESESTLMRLLEELVAQRSDSAGQTFKAGESPEDVFRSLEGSLDDMAEGDTLLDEPVTFIAPKAVNFYVIRKARHRYTAPNGEVQVTKGIHLDFSPDGRLTTSSKENVEYLRSRPLHGVTFFQLGQDPASLTAAPQEVFEDIMQAILDLDDERLAEIEQEEAASLKRDAVLVAVRAGRRKVQGAGVETPA